MQTQDAQSLIGETAYGNDGEKIGRIGQVFLDDETGQPEFVAVHTGFFGTNESLVPVAGARRTDDGVTLGATKDQVKDAPNVGIDDGHLSQEDERRLYEFYGMGYSERASDSGLPAGTPNGGDGANPGRGDHDRGTGHDTSGPTTDEAMTRSEEHLKVGTGTTETGRARLRKYVTTETETHTVPVRKEKAVLETEPITDANVGDATAGPDISEEEHEVVLREERPVVEKETVPVERVRLGTEEVVEQETVTDEVRKEHIEADGDVDRR